MTAPIPDQPYAPTQEGDAARDPNAATMFVDATDPFALWQDWFAAAEAREPNDPNAMSVATVDATGAPNVRVVLLKQWDERGFVFFTNLEGQKGRELTHAPDTGRPAQAALAFHWKSLLRQVRVRGPVVPVSDDEADAYYNSRPLGSRIGAWASLQSRPLGQNRDRLLAAVDAAEARFADTPDFPRPQHWTGLRVVPTEIEFWQDRQYRLHDRIVFRRALAGVAMAPQAAHATEAPSGASWERQLLFP